ncbi:MAG: HAD family phosphatase [Caldilineaceae bacterium]|nr:HAD family phosphatase [Caldilineaceae bacterium]
MDPATHSSQRPLQHLRAVVFDMDGLMVDTESIYQSAWREAASTLGYHLPEATLLATTGRRLEDCYAILRTAVDTAFPMPTFLELWPRLWHKQVSTHGVPRKPGLVELLDLLDERQIPKAVATSTEYDEALFTLQKAGIADRFSLIISGDQIANGKPAPDIFLRAAARLGVAPEHCLALEDSEAGVLAATTAGMVTIMVPEIKQIAPAVVERAYQIHSSLHESRRLILTQWLSQEITP